MNRYNYYDKFQDFLIFIKVDEGCNLQCSFCYQKNKTMNRLDSEEKINNAMFNLNYGIKRFLELHSKNEYEFSKLVICFFGGEPTLNLKAINTIVNKLKSIYSRKELNLINFTYTTNGIIFNEDVKDTLKNMKSLNDNAIHLLISSDNNKEAYDKNRKLIGSDKSGYEIVQENIKKYSEFLCELNGFDEKFVNVATVLATSEQIANNENYIQEGYKKIMRSSKILYEASEQDDNYLKHANDFLFKEYMKLIDNCSLNNKEQSIGLLVKELWQFKGDYHFKECNLLYSIDGNGDVNWCNKNRNYEDEVISQDKMRELSIFNREADNSHFRCVQQKYKSGSLTKDVIRPKLWEETIKKFDPSVEILNLMISDEINCNNAYNFIKYMSGSTPNSTVYINKPTSEITSLCKEIGVQLKSTSDIPKNKNVFYIDKNGDVFFDQALSKYDLKLSNIYEKHFMWFYTPKMIESINMFFSNKIKESLK